MCKNTKWKLSLLLNNQIRFHWNFLFGYNLKVQNLKFKNLNLLHVFFLSWNYYTIFC